MITLFIFTFLFISQGAAVLPQDWISFLLILLPAIYFLEKEFKKEPIMINNFFIFYLLFFIFGFLSFFTSVDKINSFDSLLIYATAIFIFLIAANEKETVFSYFKKTLIILSFLFSFSSLLPQSFFQTTALQLVYPFYPNHNHLGDFLGLTLIFLFFDWLTKKNKTDLFLFLIFIPFFIFSFSRSAYLDVFFIFLMIFFTHKKASFEKIRVFLLLFCFLLLFFLFTQKEFYQLPLVNKLYPVVTQTIKFQPRSVFSGRPEYFFQGIKGLLERPFFGFGIGNYLYPSQKYVNKNLEQVSSALNLPLTILVETGIFGFFFFLLFFLAIFKNIDNKLKPYNYLFYYLCLNFLTDYTYAIYGLFFLLFLLAGLIVKNVKNEKEISFNLYPLFSFFVLLAIFLKLTGKILTLNGLPEKGIFFFPYDHQTQQKLIWKLYQQGKLPEAKNQALDYERKSFYSYEALSFLGNFYLHLGEKNYALKLYQRLTDNNKFPSLEILKKVYSLKKEIQGKKIADSYFEKFFKNFKTTFWLNSQFEEEVYDFCFQENIFVCRFRRFYSPEPKTREISKHLPIKAIYTFNNDGFNERFDYSVKKPTDTFRILVLGDGNAFGFLVDTKDNWTEKLEDKLKTSNLKLKNGIKSFEVINLSYHSYDLAYAIERFRQQGVKYQPDLIIFMNSNFYRINEIFLPLTERYSYLENDPYEKERLKKQGKYFSSWDLAWEEYLKKVKEEQVYQKQKTYLNEFFSLYQGPAVFISLYEIPSPIKEVLAAKKQVKVLELTEFPKNKDYYFKEIFAINPAGHQKLAEIIFEKLTNYFFIKRQSL